MIDAAFDRISRNLHWCIWMTVANIAVHVAILVLLFRIDAALDCMNATRR